VYCSRRLLVHAVAEDVTSEVFLKVAAHFSGIPAREPSIMSLQILQELIGIGILKKTWSFETSVYKTDGHSTCPKNFKLNSEDDFCVQT
jgi:hypothetical protein